MTHHIFLCIHIHIHVTEGIPGDTFILFKRIDECQLRKATFFPLFDPHPTTGNPQRNTNATERAAKDNRFSVQLHLA